MSSAGRASGSRGAKAPGGENRMSAALERRPAVATLAEGFMAHVLGMLLVMSSVFVIIAGLAMVTDGEPGSWAGRVVGAGLLLGGVLAFVVGRWLMDQFAVQGGRRAR